MRNILILLFVAFVTFAATAQERTKFISLEDYVSPIDGFAIDGPDRELEQNDYCGGIMLLSYTKDLVISIDNSYSLKDKVKQNVDTEKMDNMWVHRIYVPGENPNITFYVSRRGSEAFNTKKTCNVGNKHIWKKFRVTYVERPINGFDQTQTDKPRQQPYQNKAAGIEFITELEGLKIKSELDSTSVTSQKSDRGGNNIIYTLKYPLQPLRDAKKKWKEAEKHLLAYKGSDKKERGRLIGEMQSALDRFMKMSQLEVYAEGTNVLTVQIDTTLQPNKLGQYSVVLLKKEVHVSECTGFLQEAEKLYKLRDYENARKSFVMALNARDTPDDAHITIETRMAECDTCTYYDRLALYFLKQRKQMLDHKQTNQDEWVNVNNNAIEVIGKLNKYNECDFYSSRLQKLKKDLGVPLSISFTATKWERYNQSMQEGGPIANVEVWAYYGMNDPTMKEYDSEGKFKKLVSSDLYRLLGSTDVRGQTLLELNRDELPSGLLFHPVGWGKSLQNVYMDMRQVMRQSKGSYTQRQFRLRMYYDK